MSYHSFSLDPRTILGVGPNASLDEIREAYRAKSKKHHPDVGGDEWAFRMVARAYEVLKTTTTASKKPWSTPVADVGKQGQAPDWSRIWNAPFSQPDSTCSSQDDFDEIPTGFAESSSGQDADPGSETLDDEIESPLSEPKELRTVDVELIWTRFEKEGSGRLLSTHEGDDATLSVCLVISWPQHDLVNHAAKFSSTGETLRFLIGLFDHLRGQKSVIAARSRIEDGQFVGWLSYLDVLTAQDAFLHLRDKFRARGLTVKLYTRDERVPFDWYGSAHQPVMSPPS